MTLKDIINKAIEEKAKEQIGNELVRLGVPVTLKEEATRALMRIKKENLLDLVDKMLEIYDNISNEVAEDLKAFVREQDEQN